MTLTLEPLEKERTGYQIPPQRYQPTGPNSPQRILRVAAWLIEEFGWEQHAWGSTERGFCAIGAIGEASATLNEQLAAEALFHHYIQSHNRRSMLDIWHGRNKRPVSIPSWNDAPERTAAQVLTALKAASAEGSWTG